MHPAQPTRGTVRRDAQGTDTKGEIEFRARGPQSDIVWKGEIKFHAMGREKPLETLTVERVWSWDGQQFSPQP